MTNNNYSQSGRKKTDNVVDCLVHSAGAKGATRRAADGAEL
jgi:hypothetical protein